MKTRKRKTETPEQTLERWLAGSLVNAVGVSQLEELGWEGGQVAYMEVYGMRYEKFYPEGFAGYVVIEWDGEGNLGVCR